MKTRQLFVRAESFHKILAIEGPIYLVVQSELNQGVAGPHRGRRAVIYTFGRSYFNVKTQLLFIITLKQSKFIIEVYTKCIEKLIKLLKLPNQYFLESKTLHT